MIELYLYGAGGHGKVVFFTLLANKVPVKAFVDDACVGNLCGIPILRPAKIQVPCAMHFSIGSNTIRQELQTKWQLLGVSAYSAVHPLAILYPNVSIGHGCLITAGAIVGPDTKLGDGTIINHHAVVDHDCNIGNFCHIAPSATLGGGVTLGARCLIGAGAKVLPQVTIGDDVIVGAGAVVLANIASGETVVGSPAKPIRGAQYA